MSADFRSRVGELVTAVSRLRYCSRDGGFTLRRPRSRLRELARPRTFGRRPRYRRQNDVPKGIASCASSSMVVHDICPRKFADLAIWREMDLHGTSKSALLLTQTNQFILHHLQVTKECLATNTVRLQPDTDNTCARLL